MNLTEEAVRMWETFRNLTIAELENIPEEQWDFRIGEGARTVREIALHAMQVGLTFANEVLAEEPSFRRVADPKVIEEAMAPFPNTTTKAEIIETLRATGADVSQRLKAADDLAGRTMTLAGGPQSRLSGLWFAISHETYHRGQLASYARALGLVPAMTRQMQARAKTR